EVARKAIEAFERVYNRYPNNVEAVAGLASIYQNSNQAQKAREYWRRASVLEPNDPVPFYAVGAMDWMLTFDKVAPPPPQQQLELIQDGLQNLDRALALAPKYEDAIVYKNLLLREQAGLSSDEKEKKTLTAQADELFNRALEIRHERYNNEATGVAG